MAYDRDNLPAHKSQNQLEQDALLGVIEALPKGVLPVILADRGFRRAGFIRWLEKHRLRYVVRINKGTCITEEDGRGWKLGEEGLRLGEVRFACGVRYGVCTTSVPRSFGPTWSSAGRSPGVEQEIPGARCLKSPGIWPRISKTPKAPSHGTGSEAG